MSFHKETHTVTISGGAGSFTTTYPLRGLLWQVVVEPTSSTTVWTLDVDNEKGEEVAGWDSMTGTMNTAFGLEIPLYHDKLTFDFKSVDTDEDFKIRITVRELPYS